LYRRCLMLVVPVAAVLSAFPFVSGVDEEKKPTSTTISFSKDEQTVTIKCDKSVDVGLPLQGTAPDLGAFSR